MAGRNVTLCFDFNRTDIKQLVINGVVTCLLILFGLAGAVYSCRSLRTNRLRTRFAKFCIFLCGWDTLLLICTFNFYALPTLLTGRKPWNGPLVYSYLVFYPLSNAAMTGGKCTILLLTWERFMAVKYPFRQRLRETRPAKLILATVTLYSLAICTPLFFELSVHLCYSIREGVAKPQIDLSALRTNQYYNYGYRISVLFLFDTLLPFLLVLVLTVLALLTKSAPILHEARTLNTTAMEDRGPKRSLMLGVIVKFLFCYSAPIALNFIELGHPALYNRPYMTTLVDIANLLVVWHSATNWILFGRCRCSRPNNGTNLIGRKVTRAECVAPAQANLLAKHLAKRDMTAIGRRLLGAVMDGSPGLADSVLHPNGCQKRGDSANHEEEREEAPLLTIEAQIDILAPEIGEFLISILNDLARPTSKIFEIRRRIRNVGCKHFDRGINLRNCDWVVCKAVFGAEILNGNRDSELVEAVNRFMSFIICEIKCGYLCQAVRDAQDSTV